MSDPLPSLPVTGYVIYIPSQDLYSRGGYDIRFVKSRHAKIWRNLGNLRNHLAQHIERDWSHGRRGTPEEYRIKQPGYPDDAVILELTHGLLPLDFQRSVKAEYETLLERRRARPH